MKIVNKPIFKIPKDADLLESISFCKEFAIKNNCTVLLQFKESTKPINKETDCCGLRDSFFDKTFNKHIFNE